MKILKNRTVLGVFCIVCAMMICFGLTPLFNNALMAQTGIVRVKKNILRGEQITDDMLEIISVGAHNLPGEVIKLKDEIIGKYAAAALHKDDYILPSKLSDEPLNDSPYLMSLDGSKLAVQIIY